MLFFGGTIFVHCHISTAAQKFRDAFLSMGRAGAIFGTGAYAAILLENRKYLWRRITFSASLKAANWCDMRGLKFFFWRRTLQKPPLLLRLAISHCYFIYLLFKKSNFYFELHIIMSLPK